MHLLVVISNFVDLPTPWLQHYCPKYLLIVLQYNFDHLKNEIEWINEPKFFCQEAKLIIKQYLEKIVTPIKVVIPSLNTGSKYCEY